MVRFRRKKKKKKKDFPPAAVPLLFWSSRFTLTPQRFSTVVFTLNAHGQVSYKFPLNKNKKMWLLHSKRRGVWTGYVISMCSFTCMHCACDSGVPGADVACFYPNAPFAQSRALFPSATTRSFKALVCVCSLITANQGKHTLQSGMTSIYTAVCKLFQCQNKDENKKILCMKCLVGQDIYTL